MNQFVAGTAVLVGTAFLDYQEWIVSGEVVNMGIMVGLALAFSAFFNFRQK